jgi:hypothetical protein
MLVWRTKDGTGPAKPDNRREPERKNLSAGLARKRDRQEFLYSQNKLTPSPQMTNAVLGQGISCRHSQTRPAGTPIAGSSRGRRPETRGETGQPNRDSF